MSTVLTIDQGTSGTKALVVDGGGNVLGLSEHPVRPQYLPGGGVEQDPHEVLASVVGAGCAAVAAAGVPIDVVTLANQGETVLAWDPDTGRPLSNMIVWQDRRAEGICAELAEHKDVFAQRTGLVLDPYFSAPKMAWLRRNVTRDGVVTTSDSWLVHHLTREFVTDPSTASRSLLTDLDTTGWDEELLGLFGLGDERLPTIMPCDALVGSTTAFGGTAAVGGLVVDQQAALVGEGCLRPGEAKCTFGTGAFLLANTGNAATRSTAGLAASVAWQVRGQSTYCIDGQVYTAASAVRWMEQLGYITTAADLDEVAAPDDGGVLAVPALAGLAAPWWRPDAKATISGMTLSTTVGHLVVAILQGIAAQVAELGSAVAEDLGRPLTRLRVDGGLTRCTTLMQSVADLMQIEIEVYPSAHATALGAAALARMAYDPTLRLADAVVAWQPGLTYGPRWSAGQAAEFRGRWNTAAATA
ncbi:MAG: glycerol kinase [Pseudonocardiales bacterium]|nr:glycerol kinase [Pseudonocardiales bacterium]